MTTVSNPTAATPDPAPPRLSHVHLKVRDAEQAAAFYTALLGYRVTERVAGQYVFLSAGDRHHDLALQSVGEEQSPRPDEAPRHARPGLYHVAFEVDDPAQLADVARRLRDLGRTTAAVDHGISRAVYSDDPDGNGLEFFLDTRHAPGGRARWDGFSRPARLMTPAR